MFVSIVVSVEINRRHYFRSGLHITRVASNEIFSPSDKIRREVGRAKEFQHSGIYKVSREECARLREGVPYVKVYRYNPKHLCPKLNGYGDNGQRILKL